MALYDSGRMNFDGVKTNVMGFHFTPSSVGKKGLFTITLETDEEFSAGGYSELRIVPKSPTFSSHWCDCPYLEDHWDFTWTGAGYYDNLVEEDGQRSRFKFGALVKKKTVTETKRVLKYIFEFKMPSSGEYGLIVLGGGYGVNVKNGSCSVNVI